MMIITNKTLASNVQVTLDTRIFLINQQRLTQAKKYFRRLKEKAKNKFTCELAAMNSAMETPQAATANTQFKAKGEAINKGVKGLLPVTV